MTGGRETPDGVLSLDPGARLVQFHSQPLGLCHFPWYISSIMKIKPLTQPGPALQWILKSHLYQDKDNDPVFCPCQVGGRDDKSALFSPSC